MTAAGEPRLATAYARQNRRRFLDDLAAFVRIPCVSAQPTRAGDVRRGAAWLAARLRQAGLTEVALIATGGHPLVCGAWRGAPGAPTVLIYGHYDVVPAEPLADWRTPPFEPVVRGDALFGRGACDDKGQLLCHVLAIEAWLRTARRLPVNVKCLFEGEEEIGSPRLAPFIAKNRDALHADVAIMSDTRFLSPGQPALVYGLRGKLSLELEVRGTDDDLHCGSFGGSIHNPLQALAEILARLHDGPGHVAAPGFYERVRRPTTAQRRFMARSGPSNGQVLRFAGARRSWGERAFSLQERITIRPALSVNGIVGGYQGQGAKAVIPGHAVAKLDVRLVPDQDPREVAESLRRHIARLTPPSVRSSLRLVAAAPPAVIDRDHPAMHAAAAAYRHGFGAAPAFVLSGGTIPAVDTFARVLGIPTILMGFARPDDRIHAANEKFHLSHFDRGIATCIWFLHQMVALRPGTSPLKKTRRPGAWRRRTSVR